MNWIFQRVFLFFIANWIMRKLLCFVWSYVIMMLVSVCLQVQAISLWFCIWLWKVVLNSNLLSVNFVLGFTEVLTVYFSVQPGERQDDRSRRICGSREDTSRRKGCYHTVGKSGVNKSVYTGLQWDAVYLRPYIYLVTLRTYLAKCVYPPDWIADP